MLKSKFHLNCIKLFSDNMNSLVSYSDGIKFAVLVSGGGDSIFMLELARIWSKKSKAVLFPITINHHLRKNAIDDINLVRDFCDKRDLKIIVLDWRHNNTIKSNLLSKAREARYNLVCDFCNKNDILHAMVAHNKDDIVENFFIRLNKGANIFGLCMKNDFFFKDINLIRPIYNFSKQDCLSFLVENKIKWSEDPTNKDNKYTRNRIRNYIQGFSNSNDFIKNTSITIDHLLDVSSLIQKEFFDAYFNSCYTSVFGYGVLKVNILNSYSCEVKVLILAHMLTKIRGAITTPKLGKVRSLYYKMFLNKVNVCTLHGCKIVLKVSNTMFIYRLFGKEKVQDVKFILDDVIKSKEKTYHHVENEDMLFYSRCMWDKRFSLYLSQEASVTLKSHDINKITVCQNIKPLKAKEIMFLRGIIFDVEKKNFIYELNISEFKELMFCFPRVVFDNVDLIMNFSQNNLVFKHDTSKFFLTCCFEPQFFSQITD